MAIRRRRRVKQSQPLEARRAEEAARLRERAKMLPEGRLRDEVEQKAAQFEGAFELTEMLRLPGVKALA
jgi:hypothetical protein